MNLSALDSTFYIIKKKIGIRIRKERKKEKEKRKKKKEKEKKKRKEKKKAISTLRFLFNIIFRQPSLHLL